MVTRSGWGMVARVISGSPVNWDRLVDWATDPKNIGRPVRLLGPIKH